MLNPKVIPLRDDDLLVLPRASGEEADHDSQSTPRDESQVASFLVDKRGILSAGVTDLMVALQLLRLAEGPVLAEIATGTRGPEGVAPPPPR